MQFRIHLAVSEQVGPIVKGDAAMKIISFLNPFSSLRKSASALKALIEERWEVRSARLQWLLLFGLLIAIPAAAQTPKPSPYRWTQFVQVEGQPEPIPAEWVSTPEGKFAHSIKIPNPVPKDSGYRPGTSAKAYFEHLCKTEAGEFIFKTVDNVEGFYFMRPPKRPTDKDLMDRYKLEAPEIERLFKLIRDTPMARAKLFINPPWNMYEIIEEPSHRTTTSATYTRSFGYNQGVSPMKSETASTLSTRYGLAWRGLNRSNSRELAIAGGEWIVFENNTREVLAVMRTFGISPNARHTPDGIWWQNATQCPGARSGITAADNARQLYLFVSKVLRLAKGERQ